MDLVVDTHILSKVITIYNSSEEFKEFQAGILSKAICDKINFIIKGDGNNGYVVASTLAFIEIANQFNTISHNCFSLAKFKAFVLQPPSWFLIEPISIDCANYLHMIPSHVSISGNIKPIEVNDALHVATALVRDSEKTFLASQDGSLEQLDILKGRILS